MDDTEQLQNEITDLSTAIYTAIDQKQNSIPLYPTRGKEPIYVEESKISYSQMLKHEELLTSWLENPLDFKMSIGYGHLFEIFAAKTLGRIFNDNIYVRLSPAEYDFVNGSSDPSFDILLCQKYRIGYIPLLLIDTKLSRTGCYKIHSKLNTPLFYLSGRRDFQMEIPQINILDIGLDKSGGKLNELSKEKAHILKPDLLSRLDIAKFRYKNKNIRKKMDILINNINQ